MPCANPRGGACVARRAQAPRAQAPPPPRPPRRFLHVLRLWGRLRVRRCVGAALRSARRGTAPQGPAPAGRRPGGPAARYSKGALLLIMVFCCSFFEPQQVRGAFVSGWGVGRMGKEVEGKELRWGCGCRHQGDRQGSPFPVQSEEGDCRTPRQELKTQVEGQGPPLVRGENRGITFADSH